MSKRFDPKTPILHPLKGLESTPAPSDVDAERARDKEIRLALHEFGAVFAEVAYDDLPAWAQRELAAE